VRNRIVQLMKTGVGAFVLAMLVIAVDGVTDDVIPADVIVVLGSRVDDSGEPSARLQARLDEAVAVYRAGAAPAILVSGGTGPSGFDQARVMAEYLVAGGVPSSAIWEDPEGFNTRATAENTAVLLQEQGWDSVIITTQYFHISRTRLAMHQAGVVDVGTSSPSYFGLRDLYSLPREVIGYGSYLFRIGR